VATHFKVSADGLTRDTRLREDLGGDSLDLVELVFDLEQALDVTMHEGAAGELVTVGDALRYLEGVSR
jgi:acyl carrier protein